MLRLDLPTEPFWVDCPFGVRLLCRPLTTALNAAAGTRAARLLAEIRKADPADPRITDPDLQQGFMLAEVTAALGQVLIVSWEGVGNADGSAAMPATAENIRAVLSVPEIARAFDVGISAPLARLTAEGNA